MDGPDRYTEQETDSNLIPKKKKCKKSKWLKRKKKKDLQEDLDNLNHVITHLDPDILDMKSSVPQEASLPTKIVRVMEFQLNYLNT